MAIASVKCPFCDDEFYSNNLTEANVLLADHVKKRHRNRK